MSEYKIEKYRFKIQSLQNGGAMIKRLKPFRSKQDEYKTLKNMYKKMRGGGVKKRRPGLKIDVSKGANAKMQTVPIQTVPTQCLVEFNTSTIIPIDLLNETNKIGHGQFGSVYRIQDTSSGDTSQTQIVKEIHNYPRMEMSAKNVLDSENKLPELPLNDHKGPLSYMMSCALFKNEVSIQQMAATLVKPPLAPIVYQAYTISDKQVSSVEQLGYHETILQQASLTNRHPKIVGYIVMEDLVNFQTMGDLLKQIANLSVDELKTEFFQICYVACKNLLQKLHALTIVHNDLHPDNIMISTTGTSLRIIDFGKAHLTTDEKVKKNDLFNFEKKWDLYVGFYNNNGNKTVSDELLFLIDALRRQQ